MVKASVVHGNNLVVGAEERGVDASLDRIGEECFDFDGLHGGLGDFCRF